MNPIFLHDKEAIERILRRDPYLHLYALGDLDDFFWPYTSWLARPDEQAVALLYSGGGTPVILAFARPEGIAPLAELLGASLALLPRRFYAHLSPGLADVLRAGGYRGTHSGHLFKMGLTDPARLDAVDTAQTERFGPADLDDLLALYAVAYPGNWFDPRMLETSCYYGVRRAGRIVSVAGVHVYSPRYRAAALGNVTTHPDLRGLGLGKVATARLCKALLEQVDTIGLNVRADNAPALAAYTRLGFTVQAEYDEYQWEAA